MRTEAEVPATSVDSGVDWECARDTGFLIIGCLYCLRSLSLFLFVRIAPLRRFIAPQHYFVFRSS